MYFVFYCAENEPQINNIAVKYVYYLVIEGFFNYYYFKHSNFVALPHFFIVFIVKVILKVLMTIVVKLTHCPFHINTFFHSLTTETEEKEDRLQQMFKQIEVKNMEAQRFKTAAEVAKVIHEICAFFTIVS